MLFLTHKAKESEMEELARAITDSFSLIKQLLAAATGEGGNVVSMDEAAVLESISSILQNVAAFMTELVGEIATKV